ncbi:MAG TPA: hypothetical protein VK964_04785 [Nocardioidaceae bacterium]|nr:hypothetical protein [Nocardioidaceae bacterium]
MRRALAAAVAVLFLATGCGGSDEPATTAEETPATSTPTQSPDAEPSDEPTEDTPKPIEIEIEGDRIEPNGKRVKVTVGVPIALEVESDRSAELHVHSSPEQVLEVEPGESTLNLTIDRPGIVDVEEHDTGLVILQLEVR